MSTTDRTDIANEAVRLLRAYATADERRRKALRPELAEMLVNLRATFEYGGRPDYTGKSTEYRAAYRDVFARVVLPAREADALKISVRHHIQTILRSRLSPEDLAVYGIEERAPRARAAEKTAQTDAASLIVSAVFSDDDTTSRTRRLLQLPARLLRLIIPADLTKPALRDEAREILRSIRDHVDALLSLIDAHAEDERTEEKSADALARLEALEREHAELRAQIEERLRPRRRQTG
jgi:hypothetical protein